MNEGDPPPFPAHLPRSLTDPAVIAEHDWHALCEVEALTNHWDRPGWKPGRRSYHWFIAFADQLALITLAQRCQQALAALRLDPVPPEALHMTLCRVAFWDQITTTQARSVAQAARRRADGLAPLRLTVGPLAGSRGAVRFTVSPWAPLLELHGRLTEATAAVLATGDGGTDRFRPHVSIAYSNRIVAASSVRDVVEPLRRLRPVQVTADAAHLVVLREERRTYRWDTFETFSLTG